MSERSGVRAAWLVSKYPDVSHTFILREVVALRARGFAIDTFSVNDPPAAERLTAVEREEAARTFYIKRQGARGALRAKLAMLLRAPGRTMRAFGYALRLGGMDARRMMLAVFYFVEALIVAREMDARGLQHLHVHFATPAATVGMLVKRLTGCGFSMTVHGPDEFYDASAYLLAEKIAACDFVVAISFFAQSQLMKFAPPDQWSKFEIARLGVDTAHFAPRPQPGPRDVFELLCVGRLVAAKGQAVLLEAVSRLAAQGRRVHVRLVGDGPDRAALELLAARLELGEAVEFTGSVNQDQIGAFYRKADAFALASFAEGIPVVLMEAMAMEIPCVATRIAGIPELIADDVEGLLVAPSDVDGLASAVARLMDSRDLRERYGKAGRERVEREYELGGNVDRLAEILARRVRASAEDAR